MGGLARDRGPGFAYDQRAEESGYKDDIFQPRARIADTQLDGGQMS
jgi:hypothetical protein